MGSTQPPPQSPPSAFSTPPPPISLHSFPSCSLPFFLFVPSLWNIIRYATCPPCSVFRLLKTCWRPWGHSSSPITEQDHHHDNGLLSRILSEKECHGTHITTQRMSGRDKQTRHLTFFISSSRFHGTIASYKMCNWNYKMCNWNVSILSLFYIFTSLYSCLIFCCYFQIESDRTETNLSLCSQNNTAYSAAAKSPACFSNCVCFFFFLLASHLAEIQTTQKALNLFQSSWGFQVGLVKRTVL